MIPVVTVEEMRQIDADASSRVSEETLIERAGTAVATKALEMLGGAYGRRIVVLAGKGNNGADGRVAAARLARRGAKVRVVEVADAPERIDGSTGVDMVIDAAFGTGFRGSYRAPSVSPGIRVLAVDVPSGIDGNTGEASGDPLRADATVTFAALKPGLLQGDGPALAGDVEVADIGLDASRGRIKVMEDADIALLPTRARESHKWQTAVAVVAGSAGMTGAAELCARGAYRAGAGMVRLAVPGATADELPSAEAVGVVVPEFGWAAEVLRAAERCKAIVVGPGLGRAPGTATDVRELVSRSNVPVVVDADGLLALGSPEDMRAAVRHEGDASSTIAREVVLTPHDGEYARITGSAPGTDRISCTRSLSARTRAVVLLKGSTTVVADASAGESEDEAVNEGAKVLISTAGSARLATAGSGDVLSGIIGAFLARGLSGCLAAGLAAHVHGRAARLGSGEGLVAGDLPDLVRRWLSDERGG